MLCVTKLWPHVYKYIQEKPEINWNFIFQKALFLFILQMSISLIFTLEFKSFAFNIET